MAEVLSLVPAEPVICWPWHLWFLANDEGHPRGGVCRYCQCDVAIPPGSTGLPVCLYCGMDRGLVEAVDVPFGGFDG